MRKLLLLLPLTIALSGCCACGTYVQKESKVLDTQKTAQGTKIRLKGDASFEYRSSELKPDAVKALTKVAEDILKSDIKEIQVVGHTDSRGTVRFNNRLSVDRAEAVKKLFIEKGIRGSRISTSGFGSNQPVASNDTDAGRAKNRRVEILVKEKE
jgi:outer membrane protein OmpA-like peptidoglycan-associated protein